jgi:hypothetical protein
MQRLKVEDQIQLANVFEQSIQGLDVHLDQVDQSQRGFGGRGDDDEVQCGVVAVGDERRNVVLLVRRGGGVTCRGCGEERGERQEVAGPWRPIGDECEDLGDEALLY